VADVVRCGSADRPDRVEARQCVTDEWACETHTAPVRRVRMPPGVLLEGAAALAPESVLDRLAGVAPGHGSP
jgi:hypothetical protein